MVWYQAEVAGTIIVQTLPVIRHLARDESVQKSIVSVQLNEISTTRSSKVWDGSLGSDPEKWKDMERGLISPYADDASSSGRRTPFLDPIRASWSTFSPIPR